MSSRRILRRTRGTRRRRTEHARAPGCDVPSPGIVWLRKLAQRGIEHLHGEGETGRDDDGGPERRTPGSSGGVQGGSSTGSFGGQISQAQQDNDNMIQLQIQMQHENAVFSTISNVLKVRHDTVKNTIQNVH